MARARSTQEQAIVLFCGLPLVTGISLIFRVGLSPLTLVPAILVLAFALVGPNPRITPYRDGLLLLLVGAVVAFVFARPGLSKTANHTFGASVVPVIPLAFLTFAHGDGLGGVMRRFAHTGFGSGLRAGWYRLGCLFFLVVELFGLLLFLSKAAPGLRGPALLGGLLLLLAWSVLATQRKTLGGLLSKALAIGIVLAFVGSIAGWWTWWALGAAVWAFGIPSTFVRLFGEVPPVEPPVLQNETAPTR